MRTFSKSAWMKVLHPNTNCQYPNTSRTWSVKKTTLRTLLSNFLVSHSYKQAPVSKNTPFSYDWNIFKVFVIITKFQAKHCRKNLVKVKIWEWQWQTTDLQFQVVYLAADVSLAIWVILPFLNTNPTWPLLSFCITIVRSNGLWKRNNKKFNSIGFLLHTRMKKRAKWRPNIVFETRVNFLPVSDSKHNSLRRSILQDLHHFVTTIAC